ncbi:MAG: PfkB family carbohydrate kinase, partial [Flavobacteriales bacterium]|nr:PfkB family carbohydrate kinase [Flavobacteriales bacterium]
VVGTVAFDALETPFGKTDKIVGGAATYIALAASYHQNNMKLVSIIGDDFPQDTLDYLKSRGLDQEGLEIKKGEKTFFWSGKYHNDMNTRDTLVTELNVLEHFDPVVPDSYKDVEFVMLGNLAPSVQSKVLDQLNGPKLVVMDTMNFWMDIAWDELMATIARVDVLTINDEEARQLTKEYSLVKAAQKILTMGPKYLIIKKGEHGALLFNREKEVFFAPALPLEEVFDPTGAGDSFAGGFIGYLSATRDVSFDNMKRAVIFGSAMASFTVEKFGTERLIGLSSSDVDQRVQQFVQLTQFDISLVES